MRTHYVVKPKADRDLDDQADYLAEEANLEVAPAFPHGGARDILPPLHAAEHGLAIAVKTRHA